MINVEDLCIDFKDNLLLALKKINKNSEGIVFVLKNNALFGCITDGDVRRAIINGASNQDVVESFCNQNVKYEFFDNSDLQLRLVTNSDIKVVPLVDKNKKIIDFATISRPHNVVVMEPSLGGNELNYVVDCLKTNWISSQGAYVNLFQDKLSELLDVKHCLATCNGTAALHLGLEAFGLGKGDEVITTNLTFGASVNAIIHSGAKPVLVDVDEDTWNISPALI